MKTLEDALAYAERLHEDCSVMFDLKTQEYKTIRAHGVEHWKQHYTEIAQIEMVAKISMVQNTL